MRARPMAPCVMVSRRAPCHSQRPSASIPPRTWARLVTPRCSTGRHSPEPPHLSPAWRHLGYGEGDFPVSETLARECLSLPIYPGMSEAQVDAVTDAVRDYFGRG